VKPKSSIAIGIDLGDRKHAVCVLDANGEIVMQEIITNSRGSLPALSRRFPGALMVMEVGMHSPWTSRFLPGLGHRVLGANPRMVRANYQNERKHPSVRRLNELDFLRGNGEGGRFQAACRRPDLIADFAARCAAAQLAGSRAASSPGRVTGRRSMTSLR